MSYRLRRPEKVHIYSHTDNSNNTERYSAGTFSAFLLATSYAGPIIKVNGNPASDMAFASFSSSYMVYRS